VSSRDCKVPGPMEDGSSFVVGGEDAWIGAGSTAVPICSESILVVLSNVMAEE